MKHKRILVVDDDKEILDIISYILFEKNYHVIPSRTSDILPFLEQIRPDLILLDNWLPEALGSELCKQIKADPVSKKIPIVLISAVNDLEKIAKECHADAFIEKPFNVKDLEELIAEMVT